MPQVRRYIIGHLNECGWREADNREFSEAEEGEGGGQDLKKQCVDFIQNKGVEQVSLEDRMANVMAQWHRLAWADFLRR